MHNGLLKMGTAKMAGSVGNVVNIADLLQRHSPETVRFLLLSTHYRSPIEYSEERLNEVAKSLQGFYRFFERYERLTGQSFFDIAPFPSDKAISPTLPSSSDERVGVEARWRHFREAMDEDFNTGASVGMFYETLALVNRLADRIEKDNQRELVPQLNEATMFLRTMSNILGLFWSPPEQKKLGGDDTLVAGLMQLLIDLRNNLRAEAKKIAAKDDPTKKALFEQTDVIRKRLGELGVLLEDRPGGTTWRKA
jgi:cysteinyl-tRNA synthetase